MDHNDHVRGPSGWIFGTDNIRGLPGPMVVDVQQPPDIFGRFPGMHVRGKHRDGNCWSLLRPSGCSKWFRHLLQLPHRVHGLKFEVEIFSADPGFLRAGGPRQHNLVLPAGRLGVGLLVLLHPTADIRDSGFPPAGLGHSNVPGDAVFPRGSSGDRKSVV